MPTKLEYFFVKKSRTDFHLILSCLRILETFWLKVLLCLKMITKSQNLKDRLDNGLAKRNLYESLLFSSLKLLFFYVTVFRWFLCSAFWVWGKHVPVNQSYRENVRKTSSDALHFLFWYYETIIIIITYMFSYIISCCFFVIQVVKKIRFC